MAATLGCFLTTAGCWAMRMAEEKWETFGSHHFEETKRRFSHRRILRSPRSSGFTREAVARHAEGHLGECQPWRRALGRTVNSDAARWMLGLRKSCGVFIIEQSILRVKLLVRFHSLTQEEPPRDPVDNRQMCVKCDPAAARNPPALVYPRWSVAALMAARTRDWRPSSSDLRRRCQIRGPLRKEKKRLIRASTRPKAGTFKGNQGV